MHAHHNTGPGFFITISDDVAPHPGLTDGSRLTAVRLVAGEGDVKFAVLG